jgi:hypothetical protein
MSKYSIIRKRRRDLLNYIDQLERRLRTMDSYYRLIVYLDSLYPIQSHLRIRKKEQIKRLGS